MDEGRRCTAISKQSGDRCKRAPVVGGNVCHYHGGAAPQVRAKADQRIIEQRVWELIDRMGISVETTPEEALLQQVWEAAGNVALLRKLVANLEAAVSTGMVRTTGVLKEPGIAVPTGNPNRRNEAAPHVLVRMYNEERERLVRFSKACIDAGVSERLVRLAEKQGELLVGVIEAVLADKELGLTPSQKEIGKKAIAGQLRRISAGFV